MHAPCVLCGVDVSGAVPGSGMTCTRCTYYKQQAEEAVKQIIAEQLDHPLFRMAWERMTAEQGSEARLAWINIIAKQFAAGENKP